MTDEAGVELAVEVEVDGVEDLANGVKAGVLHAPLEEPVLAPPPLVLHERGDEVDCRPAIGLGPFDPGIQRCRPAETRSSRMARVISLRRVQDRWSCAG
jgi:hypothetical protein